jgi:hypothetical protein
MDSPHTVNFTHTVNRGYPFFLRIMWKKQSTIFGPFQRKNALISTTTGFLAMENSMVTFIIYVQPRRDAMHVHSLSADRRSVSVLRNKTVILLNEDRNSY